METSSELKFNQENAMGGGFRSSRLSVIRTRCPSCQKPYVVETAMIQSAKPQFECLVCKSLFAFVYPLPQGQVVADSFLFEDENSNWDGLDLDPEPVWSASSNVNQEWNFSSDFQVSEDFQFDSTFLTPPEMPPLPLEKMYSAPIDSSSISAPAFVDMRDLNLPDPSVPVACESVQDEKVVKEIPIAYVNKARVPIVTSQKLVAKKAEADCPKCKVPNSVDATECVSCGIVFRKFLDFQEDRYELEMRGQGKSEVVLAWRDVLNDYDSEVVHRKFIVACEKLGALTFASHKYGRILSVSPSEPMAIKMRRQISGLASHRIDRASGLGSAARVSGKRLPSMTFVVLFLGGVVTATGYLAPHYGNLMGVGVAMISLVVGVRLILARGL